MTIEEMKARKAELGYTNETVSQLSGVPLGTVQKIFAGETRSPRYVTVQKLTKLLGKQAYKEDAYALEPGYGTTAVREYMAPPKKIIGIADGKYRIPPDELFFDDEISDMFDDL